MNKTCYRLAYWFVMSFNSDHELVVAVDNSVDVYADGTAIGSHSGWTSGLSLQVPGQTIVLGFKLQNAGGPASVIASLSNGVVTDGSWKCTNQAQSNDGKSNCCNPTAP